jgi:hypothetical protein
MVSRSRRGSRVVPAAVLACVVALAPGALSTTAVAATPPSQFAVVEGAVRPATGSPRPASGSHASLWGDRSTATTTVEGSGRIEVGAIGDHCDGWPRIELSVDGVVVGTSRIVSGSLYGAYPIGPALGQGRHQVRIRYVNDHRTATCDRNVHLGHVRLRAAPPAGVAQPLVTPSGPVGPVGPHGGESTASRVADGRPGPYSTGVPEGTELTPHHGDLVVDRDGAVVDGLDVHGFLRIEADDVTVRNTLVRGREPGTELKALVAAYGDHRDFVIEDSTLRSDFTTPYIDGIKGHHFTARRLDVSHVVDNAVVFGDDVLIEDSWFHDTAHFTPWPAQPDDQTHNDNLAIVGGDDILVRRNLFEGASNAAIMITQDHARSSGIRVTGNWLMEGDCIVNIAEKGEGPVESSFTGNRFGTSGVSDCAIVARDTSVPGTAGNTWIDRPGEAVVVRSRPT